MSALRVIGRYQILEELGRGTMGSVLKARDPAMDRTVAVKTILTSALESGEADEYRARFYREMRAAGNLAHPGIVPVFDVGEHEGTPFLVMEYVEGRTLATAMRTERFTLERICELGQQIAGALGYAHRKGVIHRDIKPANILLTAAETYGSERPRITDFGVAKLAAGEATTTGQLLGTPAFMAPEQFTGSLADGRADLFSLGVILYALATGEQPFPGETVTAVSYKVVHTEPVPPGRFNPALPPGLDAVILKCLEKNPADRFQTGEELAGALAELRGAAESTAMRSARVTTGGDAAATQDGSMHAMPVRQTVPLGGVAAPIPATDAANMAAMARPHSGRVLALALGAVAVVALTVGGWWLVRHRNVAGQPAVQANAPAARVPAVPAPAAVAATSAAGTIAATSKPAAAVAAATAPAAGTTAPRIGKAASSVGFDPRTLNPRTNAKLKIELIHVRGGMPFTVEMNRMVFLNGVAGKRSTFEIAYVPPGIQEFRVVVKAGGRRMVSNIVSDEFNARKQKTLRIELEKAGTARVRVFVSLK